MYFIVFSVIYEKSFEWDTILKSYWVKSKDNLYITQCSGIINNIKYSNSFNLLMLKIFCNSY